MIPFLYSKPPWKDNSLNWFVLFTESLETKASLDIYKSALIDQNFNAQEEFLLLVAGEGALWPVCNISKDNCDMTDYYVTSLFILLAQRFISATIYVSKYICRLLYVTSEPTIQPFPMFSRLFCTVPLCIAF